MSKIQGVQLAGLSAFLEEIGRSPTVFAICNEAAGRVLANAQAQADQHIHTGEYRKSLHIQELPRSGRRVVAVVSSDPDGMYIEAKLGILARAVRGAKK